MKKYRIMRIDGQEGTRLFPAPVPAAAATVKHEEPAYWRTPLTEKHKRDLDPAEMAELNSLFSDDAGDEAKNPAHGGEARRRKPWPRAALALLLVVAFLFSASLAYTGRFAGFDLSLLTQSGWLSKDPMIKELRESVVRVETAGSFGSGFNISPQGLIVTNNHVVDDSKAPRVNFRRGGAVYAKSVEAFPEADLAFLSLPPSSKDRP
ncbi:MAG: serine protease, partial [Clostridiales bacterium]|nr:serine protease [Clostridiales bacterium]